METAFLVFVCFQSAFSVIFGIAFYKTLLSLNKIKKKQKEGYSVLCSIGNDTSTNFQKVFAFIEHELTRQHQAQSNDLPGSPL